MTSYATKFYSDRNRVGKKYICVHEVLKERGLHTWTSTMPNAESSVATAEVWSRSITPPKKKQIEINKKEEEKEEGRGMSLIQKCCTQIKNWEYQAGIAGLGEGGSSNGGFTRRRRWSVSPAHLSPLLDPRRQVSQRSGKVSGKVFPKELPVWFVFLLNGWLFFLPLLS